MKNFILGLQLRSPFLREVFELLYEGGGYSLLFMMIQLAYFDSGCAEYPVKGSLSFAKQLEEAYYSLGGRIRFNTGVSKIITKNNVAVGVQTQFDQVNEADIVVSAVD